MSSPRRGAIVGMARSKAVTGDLAKAGIGQYANRSVSGNRVRRREYCPLLMCRNDASPL
jgi:hypothetical protein